WGRDNQRAFTNERGAIDAATAEVQGREGRAYAGLATNWGRDFRVGSVPVYALLGNAHIPALSYLYHAMALSSDLMVLFNDSRPDHYRLFNVRTVVAPENKAPAA